MFSFVDVKHPANLTRRSKYALQDQREGAAICSWQVAWHSALRLPKIRDAADYLVRTFAADGVDKWFLFAPALGRGCTAADGHADERCAYGQTRERGGDHGFALIHMLTDK